AANARPARAAITLEALPQSNGVAVKAGVRVPALADRKGTTVFVALVESGLVSEVKAGENAGARLTHDHVVRALRAGPVVDAAGVAVAELMLPWPVEAGRDSTVVAFVQNPGTGDVLQAVALPLALPSCSTG